MVLLVLLVQLSVRAVCKQHGVHHFVETVCNSVSVAFAYLVNGEVGGDDGGQSVLVAMVQKFAYWRYVRAKYVDIHRLYAEVVNGEQRAFLDFVELSVFELVHLVQFHAFEAFEPYVHSAMLNVFGGEQVADSVHNCRFSAPDIAVEQKSRVVLVAEPSTDFREPSVKVFIDHEFEAERFDLYLQGETEFLGGLFRR